MLKEKSVRQEETGATHKKQVTSAKERTRTITKIAILSATAFILMLFEVSVPLMPPFLKFDFSEVPVLLTTFSLGPWAGVAVEAIKNILHLPFTSTMMVGELSNFLVGAVFAFVAGEIYRRNKTHRTALIALVSGTLMFTIVACLLNYFINIPFYIRVMGFSLDKIVAVTNGAGNYLVNDLGTLIMWVFIPFNLVKGLLVSFIVHFLYKPLSPLLHK